MIRLLLVINICTLFIVYGTALNDSAHPSSEVIQNIEDPCSKSSNFCDISYNNETFEGNNKTLKHYH